MSFSYYSQDGQDRYLHENYFKDYRNGVFVDVGAHDGITINNTLFFQEAFGWNGINIEPNPKVFSKLSKSRPKCINLNCAVANTNGMCDFILNEGHTEMISGLFDTFDPRHFGRLNSELKQHGGLSTIIPIATYTLETIFETNKISHVNYLSVDVEGAEFEVIKSINFSKVFIDIIGFEDNYQDLSRDIVNYLKSRGYVQIAKKMDIFMIHTKSKFLV